MELKKQPEYNDQMCILSAVGICFVLLGHIQNTLTSPGTWSGWFPYYSFHMPLFLFITGYFFKDGNGSFPASFARFFWKKFKKLIIPYYMINGIYILLGLLTGITIYGYSLAGFLLMPWINYQPVTFAIPTWYLAALFMTEICYYLLRRLASFLIRKEFLREILLFLVILALSVGSCYLKSGFPVSEAAGVYLRSIVMLFFIHIGYLYRKYLERLDHARNTIYFAVIFLLQFLLILMTHNAMLSPGLYNLTGFGRTGFLYYCAGITGIALWLRIARLLSQIPGKKRLLLFIGKNTKYIMAFHLTGYYLMNLLFGFFYTKGWFSVFTEGFDPEGFAANLLYYNHTMNNPLALVLYFLAGMAFSLLLSQLIRFVGNRIKTLSERYHKNA